MSEERHRNKRTGSNVNSTSSGQSPVSFLRGARMDTVLGVFLLLFVFTALFTVATFISVQNNAVPVLVAVMAAVVLGVTSAASIVFLLQGKRVRDSLYREEANRFLARFAILESEAVAIGGEILGMDVEQVTLMDTLNSLENSRLWAAGELGEFRRLLRMRNVLVHEQSRSLTYREVSEAANSVRKLHELLVERVATRHASQRKSPSIGPPEYEDAVDEALQRLFGHERVRQPSSDDWGDIVVATPKGSVTVDVKYRREGRLALDDLLHRYWNDADIKSPMRLIVTNVPLTSSAKSQIAGVGASRLDVVVWNTSDSDDILYDSVMRMGQRPRDPAGQERFEIYADRAGKFRYRLIASNGEVVATSEAHESRADAVNQVRTVRRAAAHAPIVDSTGV